MIIVAWNGSGDPSVIFNGAVFKKVLSVFITAAILKFGQGRQKSIICIYIQFPNGIAAYLVILIL